MLRQFIVKFFALYWSIKVSKTKYLSFLRCGPIIWSSIAILGFVLVYAESNLPVILASAWMAFCLFVGFIYFDFFPVKWEELDKSQKIQYAKLKPGLLTGAQMEEFLKLTNYE